MMDIAQLLFANRLFESDARRAQIEQMAPAIAHHDAVGAAIPAADSPVFIVGAPRSGTSVSGWSLGQHSQMFASHEVDFLIELYGDGHLLKAYEKSIRPDGWLGQMEMDLCSFSSHWGRSALEMIRAGSQQGRWVDATPRHSLALYELSLLFPGAQFVHLVRNGKNAVNSMVNSGFPVPSARHFHLACFNWRRYNQRIDAFAARFEQRVYRVSYEDLYVERDEKVWDGLLEFLGLPVERACMDFSLTNRINSSFSESAPTPSAPDADWGPWRRAVFHSIAGPAMQRYGYP
jgi:hypothetical protein